MRYHPTHIQYSKLELYTVDRKLFGSNYKDTLWLSGQMKYKIFIYKYLECCTPFSMAFLLAVVVNYCHEEELATKNECFVYGTCSLNIIQ